MSFARSARQEAYYHSDVMYLTPLLVIKEGAWDLGQQSKLGLHQLDS